MGDVSMSSHGNEPTGQPTVFDVPAEVTIQPIQAGGRQSDFGWFDIAADGRHVQAC